MSNLITETPNTVCHTRSSYNTKSRLHETILDYHNLRSIHLSKNGRADNFLKLPAHEPFLPRAYLWFHGLFVDANVVDQT